VSSAGESRWQDALHAAAIMAVAPQSIGGAVIKAFPGPVRDTWLATLRGWLAKGCPWRRVPAHVSEARLLGGLDLAATLHSGRPVFESGLLAESDAGVLQLAMAERSHRANLAQVCAALDNAEVMVERDGFSRRNAARFGVLALDEGLDEDEAVAAALLDRVAFPLDLREVGIHDLDDPQYDLGAIQDARHRWEILELSESDYRHLVAAALALEIESPRPVLLAARVARIAAALAARDRVDMPDLVLAARLVLLPRAQAVLLPEEADPQQQQPENNADEAESPPQEALPEESPRSDADDDAGPEPRNDGEQLEERTVEAASALLPRGILDAINRQRAQRGRRKTGGKSGALRHSGLRGRPVGCVRGSPRNGGRLNLLATLRAAAPWQRLRKSEDGAESARARVSIRSEDFRITRYKRRSESTVIFVVDASGSSALHRLAESKGAVELLLADCYVRRDRVALIAFRGIEAELLLPPTRSLVRAKRSLTALPGGGGTPLAAGIEAAAELAAAVRRRGGTATVVLLTDGRANVCRDGSTGRQQALADALQCATVFRSLEARCMVVDTSMRPHANGAEVARAMHGSYLPLPLADAGVLSQAVKQQLTSNSA
jgi:magnesium chelatase subunit D